MINPDSDTLLTFPCTFPIKIMGLNESNFYEDVSLMVQNHFPHTLKKDYQIKYSKENKYIAITVILNVHDKQTLDNLYIELNKHPNIRMVL
jgi:putative lipoic acid-binding regulatory protein